MRTNRRRPAASLGTCPSLQAPAVRGDSISVRLLWLGFVLSRHRRGCRVSPFLVIQTINPCPSHMHAGSKVLRKPLIGDKIVTYYPNGTQTRIAPHAFIQNS